MTDGPTTRSATSGTSATARRIVSSPFAGEVRPSASSVRGLRSGRSTHWNPETSMPWPIATSFRERSGNVRSSTLSTLVETRSAARSSRLLRQCVNQRKTSTPSGRASGAASTA